jgi:hypothetical protein
MFVYRRNAEQYIALQSGGKWPFIYSPSDFRIEEIAK